MTERTRYLTGACRARWHGRCAGSEPRDLGDGTTARCTCRCHTEGPDAPYDTRAEQEETER